MCRLPVLGFVVAVVPVPDIVAVGVEVPEGEERDVDVGPPVPGVDCEGAEERGMRGVMERVIAWTLLLLHSQSYLFSSIRGGREGTHP